MESMDSYLRRNDGSEFRGKVFQNLFWILFMVILTSFGFPNEVHSDGIPALEFKPGACASTQYFEGRNLPAQPASSCKGSKL